MVYCTADTLSEAREDRREMFPDAVIVKCVKGPDGIYHEQEIIPPKPHKGGKR